MSRSVADTAYALGWSTVRALPERAARRQFDVIADGIWLRGGRGVDQLARNLDRVCPDLDHRGLRRLTRAGMRSYLRYWCEAFRLPTMSPQLVAERMFVVDEARLRDAVGAGDGVILALPHMGNWDHAGAWLTGSGVPFTTVAERLEPASLYDRFVSYRESLGMEVVPLTGGRTTPYPLLAERLRAGGVLCLLSDRDLTAAGVDVGFFGSTARMPAGPAALAHDTGAALLPVTLWYPDRWRWCGRIHEQVRVPEGGTRASRVAAMTQQVADAFAETIGAHPQDWHMLQKVWLDDLGAVRRDALAPRATADVTDPGR